jgi:acyl-coenzyme A synthetase/AMP-(fatty) acid ligase
MNITDPIRYRARLSADAIAIIRADDSEVTYHDLERMIDAAAARIDGLGLVSGQVAGLAMTGPDEFPPLVVALALARSGIASADPALPAKHLDIVLSLTGTRDGVRNVLYDPGWIQPPPRGLPARPMHPDGSAICRVFASSGTTGTPNFAAVSHDVMARRVYSHWLSAGPSEPVHICGVGHGFAWGFRSVLRTFWSGGTLVLTNPARAVAAIRRHNAGSLAIAPVSLQTVIGAMPGDSEPLPSLKAIEVGGAVLSAGLYEQVRRKLCGNVVSFFGSTETGGVASASLPMPHGVEGAVGYVHGGVEVQAVDAGDRPLPPGTEGILRVRSDGCITRYFGDEGPSATVFRDGWFYPGDVGSVAQDGIMTVRGRVSDFINAGGIKINPHVIEDVLLTLPDVTDAAAFGVPDRLGVIQIWAAIVAPVTIPSPMVSTFCRQKLGSNAPKFVLQVNALPRNENGKVARDELIRFALTQQR